MIGRLLDFCAALCGIVVLSPVLLICYIAVRCSSPGPALFSHLRLGINGKPFRLFKFRSMYVNAPDIRNADGSAFAGENDPRVTRIGKFLRVTSLDELPQLFNVLRGEMSLVGPRPDQVDQIRFYTEQEKRKLAVRPGLTGLAQINGRNNIPWQQRKALDLEYVARKSLGLDLQILCKTIPYVLHREATTTGDDARSPS